ncbi:Centromere/kinetochore Zw10-domain-containing protein [Entophlyctis helioformis]|nr:Centromere/kinetochore Zw10-domain-containing protein [Entophlyctis helioformis]
MNQQQPAAPPSADGARAAASVADQEAARAAQHLATSLVQALVSGTVGEAATSPHHSISPVAPDAWQQALKLVDRRLQDAKLELENDILASPDEFRSSLSKGLQHLLETRRLQASVDAAAARIEGDEGLAHTSERLVAEIRSTAKAAREAAERRAVHKALDGLRKAMTLFDDHLSSGRYLDGAKTLVSLEGLIDKASRKLGSTQEIHNAKIQFSAMRMGLVQTLDYAVSAAMTVTESSSPPAVTITLKDGISFGTGVPDIGIADTLESSAVLGILDRLLQPFAHSLSKHLIQPMAETCHQRVFSVDRELSVSTDHEEKMVVTISTVEPCRGGNRLSESHEQSPLLPTAVFMALAEFLSGFLDRIQASPSTKTLTLVQLVGGDTLRNFCQDVIRHSLQPHVPSSIDGLDAFVALYGTPLSVFDSCMAKLGISSDRHSSLSSFFDHLHEHYAIKCSHKHLVSSRRLFLAKVYDTIEVGHDASSGDQGPLFLFPRCLVQKSTVQLASLLDTILLDASRLEPRGATILYEASRDLLDLFRSAKTSILYSPSPSLSTLPPHLSMVFHNDCMYMAHWCMLAGPKHASHVSIDCTTSNATEHGQDSAARPTPTHSRELHFMDLADPFQRLAQAFFQKQQRAQQANLVESVAAANGFDCLEPARHECVERAVKQVLYHIRHIAKIYHHALPRQVYLIAVGQLVGTACEAVTKQIEALSDMAEEESVKLAELVGRFEGLHDLFLSPDNGQLGSPLSPASSWPPPPATVSSSSTGPQTTLIEKYTQGRYTKCATLGSLLNWNFATIMEAFRRGDLRAFTVNELARLARALFSDTPLRDKNLTEIARGHPTAK